MSLIDQNTSEVFSEFCNSMSPCWFLYWLVELEPYVRHCSRCLEMPSKHKTKPLLVLMELICYWERQSINTFKWEKYVKFDGNKWYWAKRKTRAGEVKYQREVWPERPFWEGDFVMKPWESGGAGYRLPGRVIQGKGTASPAGGGQWGLGVASAEDTPC